MDYVLTEHARAEMLRRRILQKWVEATMASPEQIVDGYGGRMVYQSRFQDGDKTYLIRLIVEFRGETPVIVTLYRTSKIQKYWRYP